MNIAISIFSYATIFLTIGTYIPQVVKSWKTKDVSDLSTSTFTTVFLGSLAWALYGSINSVINVWIINITLTILMIPIIYLLFLKNKKIFTTLMVIEIAVIIFVIYNIISPFDSIPSWVKYLFVIPAGAATSLSFIPQLVKVYKHKHVQSISIASMLILTGTQIVWIVFWALKMAQDIEASLIIAIVYTSITLVIGSLICLGWKIYKK